MQYKVFRVPVKSPEKDEEELNRFLRGKRVIQVERKYVETDGCWVFLVEYFDANDTGNGKGRYKSKIDYREVLSEADFAVYSRLREIRKRISEEKGFPVYAVFSNEQLAAMVTERITSKTSMKKIDGIGDGKVESYANEFLGVLQEAFERSDEKSRKPV
jgi:superfamily II DNA helicase RecQ